MSRTEENGAAEGAALRNAGFGGAEPFTATAIPEIHFGAGRIGRIAEDAREVGGETRAVLLVADAAMLALGPARSMASRLEAAGAAVRVYAEIQGDPKASQADAAAEMARESGAGLVIGLGGGSALDTAKLAAAIAPADAPAAHYALGANPLPPRAVPIICAPTTAGTGSEATRTSVVSDEEGGKLWVWGETLLPERAILDPELTLSLPSELTAWTGLDAFVHALEATTSRNRSTASELYGHEALRRLAHWLPAAVAAPDDLEARGHVLWGSCLAGLSLNLGSTAIAHCISHALGSLAPVHHGLATALAQGVTLAWQVEGEALSGDTFGPFARAAAACGVSREAFPEWYAGYLARCAGASRLPKELGALSPEALVGAMQAPANAPMRFATARAVEEADLARFAAGMMALAA